MKNDDYDSGAIGKTSLVLFGVFLAVTAMASTAGFIVSTLRHDSISIGYGIGLLCSIGGAGVFGYVVQQRNRLIFRARQLSMQLQEDPYVDHHDDDIRPDDLLHLLRKAEAYDAYLELERALLHANEGNRSS